MTKDEALKLALEALETNNKAWKHLVDSGDAGFWEAEEQPFYEMSVKAITAIKEVFAEADAYNCKNCIINSPCVCKGKDFKPCGAFVSLKQQQALDKKAENARELGLDYEPDQKPCCYGGIAHDCHAGVGCRIAERLKAATPPQRKPLTDEEIGAILEGVNAYGTRLYTFARAIEAAHNIKENT